MTWTRGQRIPVSDLGVTDDLRLGLGTVPAGFEVVVAGLDADDRLIDRGYLLSRHQRSSFEGSVAVEDGRDGDAAVVVVHLARVPSSVQCLRIALIGSATLSADSLTEAWIRLVAGGGETARWTFRGDELSGERAIIVADLYRRDGWRLFLQGTGYRAGLSAFLERIGGGTRLPGAPDPAAGGTGGPGAGGPGAGGGAPGPGAPGPGAPSPPPPAGPGARPGRAGAPAGSGAGAPGAPFPPPPGMPGPRPSGSGPAAGAPPAPGAPFPPPPGVPGPPPGLGAPVPPSGPGAPSRANRRQKPLRTGLSRTERLFSRPVGKALASPSGLGAAVGGAVVGGGAVTAATGSLGVGLVSGAFAGTVAWLGRGAAAMPGKRGDKIDPFALREPWRHFVADAVEAHQTFDLLVTRTPAGPLHDRLEEIAGRVREGLEECWRIASRGDSMREARIAIDDASVRAELASLHAPGAAGDPDARARLSAALQSQIDAATRLDRLIDRTYDELRLVDARLDDVVARAIEISATATDTSAFRNVGADVDGLVDDLEALRQGLEEVRGVDPSSGTPSTA